MTGAELKERIKSLDISQAEIARRLELTQQAFNQALNVADVKTGMLERICDVTGKRMSFFYPEDYASTINTETKTNVNIGSGNLSVDNPSIISYLIEQNKMLMKLISDK